ncbi:hypothetical protein B0H19DRAFT_952955 [Mycena capillaripes]|nr:hypothetical protein B0H19DRAFT_952955 [Mycena capillaripes]
MIARSFFLAVCALAQVQLCRCVLSNRTIDDFHGDSVTGVLPVYAGSWNVDSNCTTCYVQLDASQVFDHTWHDSSQRAVKVQNSVTLEFTGTAIYFFGIVANTVLHGTTNHTYPANVTFTLDGAFAGRYIHTPDTSFADFYSVPMLSSEGLSNKAHTLVVTFVGLLLFDFAIYT